MLENILLPPTNLELETQRWSALEGQHAPPSCLWQDALEHCARYFFVRVFVVGVAYTDRRTQAFTPLASERHLYARAADQPQTLAYIMN